MQPTETRVLITGAAGMLGSAFTTHLFKKGYIVRALDHAALNVTDRDAVLKEQDWKPDWIIHTAGIVNVDFCEDNRDACFKNHVGGTGNIIALAKETGAKLLYPQSFLIFDNTTNPVSEDVEPRSLSVYGKAKWEAEQIVRKELPDALVVRMGGFFGGYQKDKNFVGTFAHILKKSIEEKTSILQVSNRIWQPTYTKDLVENITLLLEQEKTGVYHMASHGRASFFQVAKAMVELLTTDNNIVINEIPAREYKEIAQRPFCVLLDNKHLREEGLDRMRPWREALEEYLKQPYFKNIFED